MLEEKPSFTINSRYIFFFVEKYPLITSTWTGFERQYVSEQGAEHQLPYTAGVFQYSGVQR